MADYTQVLGGVVTDFSIDRVTRPGQLKVYRLGSDTDTFGDGDGIYQAKRGEQIVRVKATGNDSANVPISLWGMDGVALVTASGTEDADEFKGPFSKVQVGDAPASAEGFIMIWVKKGE